MGMKMHRARPNRTGGPEKMRPGHRTQDHIACDRWLAATCLPRINFVSFGWLRPPRAELQFASARASQSSKPAGRLARRSELEKSSTRCVPNLQEDARNLDMRTKGDENMKNSSYMYALLHIIGTKDNLLSTNW